MSNPNTPATAPIDPGAADLASHYAIGDETALPPAASGASSTAGNSATPGPQVAANANVAKPVEPAAQSAPKHSSRLLRLAQQVGLDEKVIAETATDELRDLVLERQVNRATEETQARHEAATRQTPPRAPNGQFVKADGSPDFDAIKAAADGRVEDIGFKIDFGKGEDGTAYAESDLHPALVNALKSIGNVVHELKQGYQVLASSEINRHRETRIQAIDRVLASLPAEYEPHLGKGSRADLANDSLEVAHRMLVIQRAEKNQAAIGFDKKLEQAAKELFGSRLGAATSGSTATPGNGVVERVAEWTQSGLSVPTQRSGAAEASGVQKAVQTAERMMREQGIETETSPAGGTTQEHFL